MCLCCRRFPVSPFLRYSCSVNPSLIIPSLSLSFWFHVTLCGSSGPNSCPNLSLIPNNLYKNKQMYLFLLVQLYLPPLTPLLSVLPAALFTQMSPITESPCQHAPYTIQVQLYQPTNPPTRALPPGLTMTIKYWPVKQSSSNKSCSFTEAKQQ